MDYKIHTFHYMGVISVLLICAQIFIAVMLKEVYAFNQTLNFEIFT